MMNRDTMHIDITDMIKSMSLFFQDAPYDASPSSMNMIASPTAAKNLVVRANA
uniref:Uncharacterized protein n=1 Tax=Lepeophtheirus salmonis TaxID=72036 RepID=A0A0K2T345_LEPSM